MTKGALYHHFGSKKALAQAMIAGPVSTMVVDSFIAGLGEFNNPIDGIQACLRRQLESLTPEQISCGCPLNNLAVELSASDDDFRAQISNLYEQLRVALADALCSGKVAGQVRDDVDPADVATFLVAAGAGVAGFAKSTRDIDVARTGVRVMCTYLDGLRSVASV